MIALTESRSPDPLEGPGAPKRGPGMPTEGAQGQNEKEGKEEKKRREKRN